jgi:hypothetical protein
MTLPDCTLWGLMICTASNANLALLTIWKETANKTAAVPSSMLKATFAKMEGPVVPCVQVELNQFQNPIENDYLHIYSPNFVFIGKELRDI